jgi:hypothetical protein
MVKEKMQILKSVWTILMYDIQNSLKDQQMDCLFVI